MSSDRNPPVRTTIRNVNQDALTLAWWQIALVAALALALALGILNGLTAIFRPLMLLALAVVIASAVEPIVRWLAKWLPRTAATVIVYVAILLVFVAIGWFAVPRIAQQASQLTNDLPRLLGRGQQTFRQWDPSPGNQTLNLLFSQASNFAGGLAQLPMTIFSMLLDIVVVYFLALFWSIFLPSIRDFVLSLFAPHLHDDADDVIREMGHYTGGYVQAVVIDAVVVGVATLIGMLLIGVNFAVLIALVAALGEVIPIVGPIIAGAVAVGFTLLQSPQKALFVLIFFVVLQQIESNILMPLVVHRTASIPPPLALFAFLAGSAVGGPLVAITAIPVSGAIFVLILRVVAPAIRRWSGAQKSTRTHPQGEHVDVDERPLEVYQPAREA